MTDHPDLDLAAIAEQHLAAAINGQAPTPHATIAIAASLLALVLQADPQRPAAPRTSRQPSPVHPTDQEAA
ncbi:hypothetical protein [Raineyella sp. W15-4]|uniref:hypothetical protein n=1 Tax=Raineyella sp. W15-4 TaxID=3081651 RepID=UPI00295456F4|nr:hypothetical protein [Raineyella sp. W15-4]WOQ15635.1 hypothetical protein R0145_10325 [Raineyella sp. W15-4]